MIHRAEPWGAWVRVEEALVAVNHDGVRALGLAWQDPAPGARPPLEVHVAVTSRCAAGCEGCYLDAKPDGIEPPRTEIEDRLRMLARSGVFTVAFGGGEPTLRDDLGALADFAREQGLTPVVTTSGIGLGPKKIAQLTRFAQVNVSYDGAAEDYAAVRGFDGAAAAESAITKLAEAGVLVGVNVVLTRATFPQLATTLARAFSLGAKEAQLLRYKPAGRATNLDYLSRRLSAEQVAAFPRVLRGLPGRVRIDCALVPFLASDPELTAESLARWGVFGCEAGGALAATRIDGQVAPCSFAGPTKAASVTGAAWTDDAELRAFRDYSLSAPEPCASCKLRAVCKGGCKIVSRHLTGGMAPDPECPRVRA